MNQETKERLECVADWLESIPPEKFNMEHWFSNATEVSLVEETEHETTCGTMCCIAGWAVLKKGYVMKVNTLGYSVVEDKKGRFMGTVPEVARKILGLTEYEKSKLFYPGNWPQVFDMFPNTPKGAAERIRHFIETGE